MTAAVLCAAYRTHASPNSFNNEIGVPMTLLGAPAGTEVVVAELGARRKGDVAMLCDVARPGIVVVTNVGVAHIEIFGSWEAIVEAAAEPVDAVLPDGWAVLNADDPVVAGFRSRCAGSVMTFGRACRGRRTRVEAWRSTTAAWRRSSSSPRATSARRPSRCRASTWCRTPCAAAAVGCILGVPLDTCAQALGTRDRLALAHGDLHHR